MQAVIYIFRCPKGRAYAGQRTVSPEALRTWPDRGTGPLPDGYTGSGNPWWRVARKYRAALVWRILARVDGARADVDAAERRAIRLARAVFGRKCVNVLSGGGGMTSADCDPGWRKRQSAAQRQAFSRPEVKERHRKAMIAFHARPEVRERGRNANSSPEVKERRSASNREAQNRPDVRAKKSAKGKAQAQRQRARTALARCALPPSIAVPGVILWTFLPTLRVSISGPHALKAAQPTGIMHTYPRKPLYGCSKNELSPVNVPLMFREDSMKFRVTVANVWWVEAETLAHAQGTAMREAGALAASLGHAVEARVTDPAGAFAGAALGRATGDADWLPFGSARAQAA